MQEYSKKGLLGLMLYLCNKCSGMGISVRTVDTSVIEKNISEMCIEANLRLSDKVKAAIFKACDTESSDVGKNILGQLCENMELADKESIPICQDTGMAVVFVSIGQEVCLTGKLIEDAINDGIRDGYKKGYLRCSVVSDPIERINTNDNAPGIIHYNIVAGDKVEITVAPKGFGSENMSRVFMLKPADGREGVKKAVIEAIKDAGPNACPPMFVGVGVGGDFEKCALLAKKALTRKDSDTPKSENIALLEKELLAEANKLNIGPSGFGGDTTVLGINIEAYPTHIAGLPVAVNICCHVNRHVHRVI